MKQKIIKTLVLVFAGAFIFSITSGFSPFQKNPWNVPAADKNKANPVASNAESIAAGKALYGTHCKSCHGTKGLGDGPKAAQLKTEAGDFSKADFQAQTDGAIFYKTSEGRDDMPSFKKKIPDAEERWSIVNYMRTFKK
jgi:mono/diheme cytochrome c family protein